MLKSWSPLAEDTRWWPKSSLFQGLHLCLKRGWEKNWTNFAVFPFCFLLFPIWQNTMQSHIIFNNYVTTTNPLRLGYIDIWGVGSVSNTSVSISLTNGMEIPTFTYNSATQVGGPWKVQWYLPALVGLVQSLFPFQMLFFPDNLLGISIFSVSAWTAWR